MPMPAGIKTAWAATAFGNSPSPEGPPSSCAFSRLGEGNFCDPDASGASKALRTARVRDTRLHGKDDLKEVTEKTPPVRCGRTKRCGGRARRSPVRRLEESTATGEAGRFGLCPGRVHRWRGDVISRRPPYSSPYRPACDACATDGCGPITPVTSRRELGRATRAGPAFWSDCRLPQASWSNDLNNPAWLPLWLMRSPDLRRLRRRQHQHLSAPVRKA